MPITIGIMRQSSSLRLIISSLVIILTIKLSESYDPIFGTELQLIHRDHLHGHPQLNQSERIRHMLYRDRIRMENIRMSSSHNRRMMQQNNPTAAFSARYGVGGEAAEYYAKLMIGTPPKEFLFIVDTGSDLTWVDCKYKKLPTKAPVLFDADCSSSFHPIRCSSKYCSELVLDFLSYPCIKENYSCAYDYSFGRQVAVLGIFANETVTFNLTNGQQATLNNTLIGCTYSPGIQDYEIPSRANGVLGLGNSKFSVPTQASRLFKNMFSYCIPYIFSNKSSKLFLGASHTIPKNLGRLQTTRLELKAVPVLYGVYIQSISIGGRSLNIIPAAWEFNVSTSGGGSVIDSGSSFAYLAPLAYKPVMVALTKPLRKFKRVINRSDDELPDYCYASKGFDAGSALAVEIGFEGGAKLRVLPSSYLIHAHGGTNQTLTCVGIVKAGGGQRNLIGNLFQQGYHWEFDVGNGKLNFATSDCDY